MFKPENNAFMQAAKTALPAGRAITANYLGYKDAKGKERADISLKLSQWKDLTSALKVCAADVAIARYNRADYTEKLNQLYKVCRNVLGTWELQEVPFAVDADFIETVICMAMGTDKKLDGTSEKVPTPVTDAAFRGSFERMMYRSALELRTRTASEYELAEAEKKAARKARKEAEKAVREAMIDTFRADAKGYMTAEAIAVYVGKVRKEAKDNAAVKSMLEGYLKAAKESNAGAEAKEETQTVEETKVA